MPLDSARGGDSTDVQKIMSPPHEYEITQKRSRRLAETTLAVHRFISEVLFCVE